MRSSANIFLTATALSCLLLASALPNFNQDVYDTIIPWGCYTLNITVGSGNSQRQGFVSFPDLASMSSSCTNTTVYLETSPGHQLYVRFRQLRIDCMRGAYLNVRGNTSSHRYCSSYSSLALYSSANFLYFTYYHGSNPPTYPSNEAIEFYYTDFSSGQCLTDDDDDDDDHHDNDHDDDDDDDGREFRCNNYRCIDARVKCDGYDNCGDWSDESSYTCGLSTGVIIAISITCSTVGLALLACIVACCLSSSKKKKNRTGVNAEAGHRNMAAPPAQTEPMAPLQCTLPAPPPYMQSGGGGNVYIGWAAPYDGLDDGAKPPQYDEIGNEKNDKN